jgi:hypothetical protein
MPHAIIRGKKEQRHEVDFGEAPFRIQIYSSEETVEIFIEANFETLPEERRRFALVKFPATGSAKRPPQPHDVPRIPYCILGVLRNFVIPAELSTCLQREGGPPVSLSRWNGIQVEFAGSIDRACRADPDFAHCSWLARHSCRFRRSRPLIPR